MPVGADYLRPGEVAKVLHVTVKTLNRWVKEGMIVPMSSTLGGHRRYSVDEVKRVQAIMEKR